MVEETKVKTAFRKGAISVDKDGSITVITDQTVDANMLRAAGEAANIIYEDQP